MQYLDALKHKHDLENRVAMCAKSLKALSGGGAFGLTPDSVESTHEWKAAKANYSRAFEALRMFNATFTKVFKKEYAATRKAYRQQLTAK